MFSLLAMLKGSMAGVWAGVMGVRGDSSPASEDAQDIDPVLGLPDIHDPRLFGHEPEGASPGVGMPADMGVAGASGLYANRRPERYHSRQTVEARP